MQRGRLLAIGLLILTISASLSPALRAQEAKAQGENTPEAVFQKATASMQAGDLAGFAGAMDPAALKQFQKAMLDLAEHAKSKGKEKQVLEMFSNAKKIDDLKALTPDKFLASFYEGMFSRNPAGKQMLSQSKNTILGHVDDPVDRDRTYVVYRADMKGREENTGRPNVANLRKVDGRWMMLLGGDLEGLATLVKQGMEGPLLEFPKPETVKIEPLGHFLEKDETARVVYRITTPIRDSKFARYTVFTLKKTEDGWKEVHAGDIPRTEALIREAMGLEVKKEPAPNSPPQRKPALPKARAKAKARGGR